MQVQNVSQILKISIFATGCAGIVSEFVLSTLAAYLSGNAVFQWTIVMSLMLFSMGVGSRVSKNFNDHLLDTFILVEFILSILCASCAIFAYGIAAYIKNVSLFIYLLAIIIGALIGLEIPLVTRINEAYEELSSNIASVMEKDYYGALLGGLFFAFIALPYLGLTYTPIVLGTVNALVASLFLIFFFRLLYHKKMILFGFGICFLILILLTILSKPILLFGEQRQYADKVIFSKQSKYQKIVMTQWKDFYWLFINGQEQFSTYDEERYHEPLVYPAMMSAFSRDEILILGGGDGLGLREVEKYDDVKSITLVDIDPEMTRLASQYPILVNINKGSMKDPRLKVINQDAGKFLRDSNHLYDVIIIDLPDPDTIDLMHLYSQSFYGNALKHLKAGGILVTQASSPVFSRKAFWCIIKTMESAGFITFPYHNQVPTMGEWGWVLAAKNISKENLKKRVLAGNYNQLKTRFLNNDGMISMAHFGKDMLNMEEMEKIKINTQMQPVLHQYYWSGSWSMY